MKYLALFLLASTILFDCSDDISGCGDDSTPSGGNGTGNGGGNGGGGGTRDSAIVLQSSDGGRTWYNLYTIDEAKALYTASAPSGGGLDFVVGGTDTANIATIYTTHDAGFTWVKTYTGGFGRIEEITRNGASLFAVTGFSLLRSMDLGDTWDTVASDPNLKGISFSGQTGVAIGEGGDFLKSTDYGNSWSHLADPSVQIAFNDITIRGNLVVAVGNENPSIPFFPVFYSHDGGMSWIQSSQCTGITDWVVRSAIIVNDTIAICATNAASSAIMQSKDVGMNWCSPSAPTSMIPPNFEDIISEDGQSLAVGPYVFWRSDNEGDDWYEVYSSNNSDQFYGVAFPYFPDSYGIAVGVRNP